MQTVIARFYRKRVVAQSHQAAAGDDVVELLGLVVPVQQGDMAWYERAIHRTNLLERIIDRIGYIPDQDVPLYFSAADAVVLPYRSATQSGITAIAQHFHKPVIATDVGGLKEFVENERTGIIVGRPEARASAAGIQRFYALGPAYFAPHLEAARERSSWSRFAEELVAFAQEVGASKGG